MEKWIKNNESKLMVLAAFFIMWCFYSVVHQGGNVVHRLNNLENKYNSMNEKLHKHEESIHYGRKSKHRNI